jgi:glycosyltransferase involved in cell wall biosynthesis
LRVGSQTVGTPRVSVVIPVYNIAPFVKETLDSVFAQTYNNFEVIIINDGSTDTEALEAALAPYFDRLVYAKQENSGASQARNAAICLSKGDYLAFLDGDDIWLPDFLSSQVEYLEKNNLDMVYCDAELFGEPLFEGEKYTRTSPSRGAVTTESLIGDAECNVITSGTVLKKDWVVRLNMFDTELRRMQDFDLWYRLAKRGAANRLSNRCSGSLPRSSEQSFGNKRRALVAQHSRFERHPRKIRFELFREKCLD